MNGQSKKEDIRIVKTIKSLMESLSSLLRRKCFNQITVNDLCEQARISRTTFYTYYSDKYDLLTQWLGYVIPASHNESGMYPQIYELLNDIALDKSSVIHNLFTDADDETLQIFQSFIMTLLKLPRPEEALAAQDYEKAVRSILYAGGIFSYVSWLVKNSPENPEKINKQLEITAKCLFEWEDS